MPEKDKHSKLDEHVVPDESFLMVAQVTWEDDIIWDDGEETKQKVIILYRLCTVLIECWRLVSENYYFVEIFLLQRKVNNV
mgnify:CR=1 FL=1